jgi:hypothetical protein
MPSRKLAYPSTHSKDRRPESRRQQAFVNIIEDEPPTKIPQDTLSKAINCHAIGDSVEPRNGSLLWAFNWPNIREGYAAHKANNVIVSDSGNIFTEDDIQNLWVWDNGYVDEMVAYISPTRMRCSDTDPNTGTACAVRGKLNLFEWQGEREVFVVQRGTELFVGTPNFTSKVVNFEKVVIFSRDVPSNALQDWEQEEKTAYINGSGGFYKINLYDSPPTAYRLNTPIMNTRPLSTTTGEKKSKYRYLIACALLENAGNFDDRLSGGVKILSESGTNTVDGDRRDWAEINTE